MLWSARNFLAASSVRQTSKVNRLKAATLMVPDHILVQLFVGLQNNELSSACLDSAEQHQHQDITCHCHRPLPCLDSI